ncbi:hypothetical protein [Singulisphaera sp. PoT]|uniref:hypothetical protein n=1 Tax=Singulisphaera sp. PoT TaxID=3411797 RepID=UPI003BF55672
MLAARSRIHFRAILALIVVIANVGAPFRTMTSGRALLHDRSQHQSPHEPIVRVRAISTIASAIGHRAVVGLQKGGPESSRLAEHPWASLALLGRSRPKLAYSQKVEPRPVRPTPPLRC